ncbi:MAG: SpoIIE family protein phosphatase [Flavobacteriales bacterium]|nr:SpoIIE family protein phosphatase [Flavobacteriales bacterium]MCB9363749.1 SpoIIE family protein phosphatase [Flavobacteriales bacterium]
MKFIKNIFFIVILINSSIVSGQKTDKSLVSIITDTTPVSLKKVWKYHQGDNVEWAKYDFNDVDWDTLDIDLNLDEIPKETFKGNCWFRLRIVVDSSLVNKPLGLILSHTGASEVYIDGKLVHQFGKIGLNKTDEKPYSPDEIPIGIVFDEREYHLIAIRYSNHNYLTNYENYEENKAGISIAINNLNETTADEIRIHNITLFVFVLLFGILFALSFLHFLLYLFYKKHKVNLYYSLFALFFSLLFLGSALLQIIHIPSIQLFIEYYIYMLIPLSLFMLITFLYSLFYSPFPKIFWAAVILTFFPLLFFFVKVGYNELVITAQALFVIIEAVRVIIRAIIKNYHGANILGVGIFSFAIFIIGIIMVAFSVGDTVHINISGSFGLLLAILVVLALLSIPISMSVYLAKDFATVNSALENEKNKLEQRVIDRTTEVVAQKELVEEKNKEITDSIQYAKRIQNAILPPLKVVKKYLQESFILYKPKDIVAGDFYWMERIPSPTLPKGKGVSPPSGELEGAVILFAAADCTGHGVPGAMVSVVCNNGLNRSVREYGLTDPGEILNKTREIVIAEFEKSEDEVKDGMDIALCSLEQKDGSWKLKYAGANNPLWIIRNNEIIETKANKQPIGKFDELLPYTTHTIELQKGDSVYISSDGYADQFGGEKGKKLKSANFKKLLLSIQNESMEKQKQLIDEAFENWKGNLEQLDDVCVIGVKV